MTDSTFELYAEDLLALTMEQFKNSRQEDMIRMIKGPTSPLPAPTTPMITFTGHSKGATASESQIACNHFKKGTKKNAALFPFSRMTSTMILSRDVSWQPSKHKDSLMLLIQILIQMMEINMRSNSFWKTPFVYSVLVTSLQTDKGRELQG